MCANNPPALPVNGQTGTANMVEVILAQQQNTFFASLFLPNVTIATRAVATVTNNKVCLLTLGGSGSPSKFKGCKSGFGICINGGGAGKAQPCGTDICAPGCSIVSDANTANAIDLNGGAGSISAGSVSTAGNVASKGTITPPPEAFQTPVADPYASTLTHANFLTDGLSTASACTSSTVGGVTTYTNPGSYSPGCVTSNGLNVSGTVNLSPGTYWITDGDLTVTGTLECMSCSIASGAGVTIILTTAKASGGVIGTVAMAPGNNSASLNAPTSGTFAGDLIVQDSNGIPAGTTYTPTSTDLQGNASAIFTGLVYMPTKQIGAVGNSSVSGGAGCLVLIVQSVALVGTSNLDTTNCTQDGVTTPIQRTVALTQ